MSTTTANLGLFKYNTSTDSNVAFNIQTALNDNWDKIDQAVGSGSSRNIGEIVSSTIPLTDTGLHLLDGALIQGSGIYSAFVTYIAGLVSTYPNLFSTESEWQASISQYGVCGKFVYDSVNNTVRLPKYSNKIYTQDFDTTAPVVGNGLALGLINQPNQTTISPLVNGGYNASLGIQAYGVSNPITPNGTNNVVGGSGTWSSASPALKYYGVTTDTNNSGLIADLTNITTSLDGYYYIVVATSTKTDIQIDIDEIATDLNGKADVDLSNCTKPHIVETYVNGSSWYRVYSDGWCEQGGKYTKSTGGLNAVTINLLKNFLSTDYLVNATAISTGATVTDCYDLQINSSNKTTSSFSIGMGAASAYWTGAYWRACGYIS